MSGTYNSAMAARAVYLEEHPQAKVRVIDSKSTECTDAYYTGTIAAND